MVAIAAVLLVNDMGAGKARAKIMYAVWVIAIQFSVLFRDDLHRQVLEL